MLGRWPGAIIRCTRVPLLVYLGSSSTGGALGGRGGRTTRCRGWTLVPPLATNGCVFGLGLQVGDLKSNTVDSGSYVQEGRLVNFDIPCSFWL